MWLCASSTSIIENRDLLAHLNILTIRADAQFPRQWVLPRNAAIATTATARLQPANIFSFTLIDDLQEAQVAARRAIQ
jgi:hypothetical protein